MTSHSTLPPDIAGRLAQTLADPAAIRVTLDGDHLNGKPALLRALAEQLHFPGDFGQNWDALNDCLQDLSWLDLQHGLLIIFQNTTFFQAAHPTAWRVTNAILLEAVQYWSGRGVSFFLIFA